MTHSGHPRQERKPENKRFRFDQELTPERGRRLL